MDSRSITSIIVLLTLTFATLLPTLANAVILHSGDTIPSGVGYIINRPFLPPKNDDSDPAPVLHAVQYKEDIRHYCQSGCESATLFKPCYNNCIHRIYDEETQNIENE